MEHLKTSAFATFFIDIFILVNSANPSFQLDKSLATSIAMATFRPESDKSLRLRLGSFLSPSAR